MKLTRLPLIICGSLLLAGSSCSSDSGLVAQFEFNGTVVQQNGNTGPDLFGKFAIRNRNPVGIPRPIIRLQTEGIPGHQLRCTSS